MNIFNVIRCPSNERFEKFLHKHDYIIKFAYKNPINDKGQRSSEVFLMTDTEISKTLEIAKRNVCKFTEITEKETLSAELAIISDMQKKTSTELSDLSNMQKKTLEHINTLLNQKSEIPDELPKDNTFKNVRKHTQTKGPKVQRYSKDGKKLIKTYVSPIEATRDSSIPDTSQAQIRRSVAENTVYKGFRWAYLKRAEEDHTVQILAKTSVKKGSNVNVGLIAMLDLDKTKIVNVFENAKEAAKNRKFKSGAPISKSMRQGTQSGGHYFKLWRDCEKSLKEDYLNSGNILPVRKPTKNSKQVEQMDKNGTVEIYGSVQAVIKKYHISRKTLYDAITHEYPCKGYKWKYA